MLTVHRQQQCPFPAWLSPTSCSTTASTTTLPRYHVTTLPCCHIATLPHCHVATLPSYHVTTLPCYHITTLPLPHYIYRTTTTTTNKDQWHHGKLCGTKHPLLQKAPSTFWSTYSAFWVLMSLNKMSPAICQCLHFTDQCNGNHTCITCSCPKNIIFEGMFSLRSRISMTKTGWKDYIVPPQIEVKVQVIARDEEWGS